MAWADWLWLGESWVRRDEDYKEKWQRLEPDVEAHREWNREQRRVGGVANERAGWMYASLSLERLENGDGHLMTLPR